MKYAVFALLLFFQEPQEDPHKSQPVKCDNFYATTHKCSCAVTHCNRGKDKVEPDSKCQTYCRPKACSCMSGCTS